MGAGRKAYAMQPKPSWVELTHVRLKLPRLGKAFDGFRLVQISDIHMGGWMNIRHFSNVMKLALYQGVDLLALTGDFVNYYGDLEVVAGAIEDLSDVFKTLGDVPRVGVLGNHDLRSAPSDIRKMMERYQILDLTNSVHTIMRGGELLHIAGVDDLCYGHPDLNKVVSALPKEGSAILLSHEPDFADVSAQAGCFDLQISGHSHGGQVVFPFVGPLYLPRGARKYYSGLYQVGTMLQYTNRGIGTVAPFFRLNCRPEITVFTLKAS
jgi:predicted MPP superfamily phosphohydrolase